MISLLFAEVDEVARALATLGVMAAFGKIAWDIVAFYIQGASNLVTQVGADDEPPTLWVKVTNVGRRSVYVQKAVLCWRLGGQDRETNLLKAENPDNDSELKAFGQTILFSWTLAGFVAQEIRLAFQEDPECFFISVRSQGGEVKRIPNEEVQGILRHLLNEWEPPVAG
jgi:hypothetical protein